MTSVSTTMIESTAAPMTGRRSKKIGFFIHAFPSLSETFILQQIVSAIRQGHEVTIRAERPDPMPPKIHEDVERFGLMARTRYREPLSLSKSSRITGAMLRLFRWGWCHPAPVLDSLNYFRHRRPALNLSLINTLIPLRQEPERYDVIHCHFGPNGQKAVALKLLGLLKGPIITTFHGYDANLLPKIHGPKLYTQLFKHGDLFTVGSEFMRRRILALGAPPDKIVKIPMGVDLSRHRYVERSMETGAPFKLLTVARLVEVKGIEFALRAAAIVKSHLPSFRYQIAGDGRLREKLERLAGELGLSDTVEFLGAVSADQVIPLLQSAHAFLLPSIVTATGEEENQPVVLAEAQAAGLPVIATNIGGVSESMRDGESGHLVPPRNPEAIAQTILRVAQHPESWAAMGRTGRRYVEEHFDLQRLNEQLMDTYHAVSRASQASSTYAEAHC